MLYRNLRREVIFLGGLLLGLDWELQDDKTLSRVLHCPINEIPKEITWMKVRVPFPHTTLVTLDVKAGKKSGPGYESGRFNISTNYSLEINRVKPEDDKGEYFCEMKTKNDEIIFLHWNDTGQLTYQPKRKSISRHLRKGQKGVLPCVIYVPPKEVTWMKLLGPKSIEVLATLDVDARKISGSGYQNGLFNITKDYSLQIYKVMAEDKGKYFCEIKNNAYGIISSGWIVRVQVYDGTGVSTDLVNESPKEVTRMKVLEIGVNAATDADTVKEVVLSIFVMMLIILAGSAITSLMEILIGVLSYREFKYSDRISYYELWKLTKYAHEFEEQDTLKEAVKCLISDSLTEDLYESLRSWKVKCDKLGRTMNQPEEIYKKCSDAGMVISLKKFRDLRLIVSNVVDATSSDLEHILWQIGKQSVNNITGLLGELKVDGVARIVHMVDTGSGLTEIVVKAAEMLLTWKEGFFSMNPIVKLNLALEKLRLSVGENDLFQVPEYSKKPLSEKDIKDKAYDATIRHCKKIRAVITSQDKSKDIPVINQIPTENNEVLFNTYQMIKDWLVGQECSNYEKRRKLQDALHYVQSSVFDDELSIAEVIKQKTSGDRKNGAEIAYDLLMTDIQPFARALGVDESKLQEYKVQGHDPSQLTMGTAGLVAMLVD